MNTPVLDRPLLTNLARAAAYGGLALVDPNRVRGLARVASRDRGPGRDSLCHARDRAVLALPCSSHRKPPPQRRRN